MDKHLVNILAYNQVKKAFNTLGVEGTLQVIEAISLPVLRVLLRTIAFRIVYKGV